MLPSSEAVSDTMFSTATNVSNSVMPEYGLPCSILPSPPQEAFRSKYDWEPEAQDSCVSSRCESLLAKKQELEKDAFTIHAEINILEHKMCKYRETICHVASFLKTERETMGNILKEWINRDLRAVVLYNEVKFGPYIQFQDSICNLMNDVAKTYPNYEIKPSEDLGTALDNALCAVEVSSEDILILQHQLVVTSAQLELENQREAMLQTRLSELMMAVGQC